MKISVKGFQNATDLPDLSYATSGAIHLKVFQLFAKEGDQTRLFLLNLYVHLKYSLFV